MGRIIRLDSRTSDLIAAGEVIEGPFSVVRELWDNAVDAGAKRVNIDLVAGGTEVIRVSDDGQGMEPDDAVAAFERHATSKIRSLEDLSSLGCLGFRGEALPSIAAVARVELTTCPAHSLVGTRVAATGGAIESVTEVGAPTGTTVVVTELFHNTPVRRKGLLRPSTELSRCLDVLRGRSLARPDVGLLLSHGGRPSLAVSGSGEADQTMSEVFGGELADRLLSVAANDQEVLVSGFIARPDITRANRGWQQVVVNGRAVTAGEVVAAVEEAYRRLIPLHRYPAFVLYVSMPGDLLDINVHPSKADIRFFAPDVVRDLVGRGITSALREGKLLTDYKPAGPMEPGSIGRFSDHRPSEECWEAAAFLSDAPTTTGSDPDRSELSALEIIGQLGNSYILCSGPRGLYIIDQHAAHERVFFDQLLDRDRTAPAQELLEPQVLSLSPVQVELAVRWSEMLRRSGFGVEQFGEDALVVRAVPSGLGQQSGLRALEEVLGRWRADGPKHGEEETAGIALAACKAAVKAHAPLSAGEMKALISLLSAADNPTRCAHGRPTVLRYDWERLRKGFLRS